MSQSRGPGFFAPDAETALRERAQWMEQLGPSANLTSDDLSDSSSEWDVGNANDEPPKPAKVGDLGGVASELIRNFVDNEGLNFNRAKAHFAKGDGHLSSREALKKSEPPARSLQRLREEVDAFCTWSATYKNEVQRSAGECAPQVVLEADKLGREARDVAQLVQQVVKSVVDPTTSTFPKRIWLPTQERSEVAAIQQIVEFSRTATAEPEFASDSQNVPSTGLSYQLSTSTGPKGNSWLMAAESELVHGLEERIQCIREALGHEGNSDSLVNTAAHLHQRLNTLQKVGDDKSCEQLRASVQLLSSDIDMAIAEANRLEVLEAEEREIEFQGGSNVNDEDAPAQIAALYEQVASLDTVATHVIDVDRQLTSQEQLLNEISKFADDLGGAEARISHLQNVLQVVKTTTEKLCASATSNREQLQNNIRALEVKLAARSASRGPVSEVPASSAES